MDSIQIQPYDTYAMADEKTQTPFSDYVFKTILGGIVAAMVPLSLGVINYYDNQRANNLKSLENTQALDLQKQQYRQEVQDKYVSLLSDDSLSDKSKKTLLLFLEHSPVVPELKTFVFEQKEELDSTLFKKQVENIKIETTVPVLEKLRALEAKMAEHLFKNSSETEPEIDTKVDQIFTEFAELTDKTGKTITEARDMLKSLDGVPQDVEQTKINFATMQPGDEIVLQTQLGVKSFEFELYDKPPTNFGRWGKKLPSEALIPGKKFIVLDKDIVGLRKYKWLKIRIEESGLEGWYSWENILSQAIKLN